MSVLLSDFNIWLDKLLWGPCVKRTDLHEEPWEETGFGD